MNRQFATTLLLLMMIPALALPLLADGDDDDNTAPAGAATGPTMTVQLQDGTRLVARLTADPVTFVDEAGKRHEVKFADVAAAVFRRELTDLYLRDAASTGMRGAFDLESIHLTNDHLGALDIPLERLASLAAGGVDDASHHTAPADTRPLRQDTAANFPAPVTRIDFETDPDGRPLVIGENVERRFIAAGFTLSTSIPGAFVSVNSYIVGGRSKQQSCATHIPLFRGEITIRFCMPGREHVPAGVHRVGLWIAYVSPNGTSIEAYDANDQRIAVVPVVGNVNDFLGVESRTPIAYIKVVPNMAIDPDYTIDDLVFDTPRPLAGSVDLAKWSVEFANGDILCCGKVDVAPEQLTLSAISVKPTAEPLVVPLAGVRSFVPPHQDAATPAGAFNVRLNDGSILRAVATAAAGVRAVRLPALALDDRTMSALWGNTTAYAEPTAKDTFKAGAIVVLANGKQQEIGEWDLLENRVGLFGDTGGISADFVHATSPVIWFRPCVQPAVACGRVLLTSGETLILQPEATATADGFSLKALDATSIHLTRGESTVSIPLSELAGLWMPR